MLKQIRISTCIYLKDDEVLASPCAFETIVNLAKKYALLCDQVDCMLSMARRKIGKAVDDGDSWDISDDVFQEVEKALCGVQNGPSKVKIEGRED